MKVRIISFLICCVALSVFAETILPMPPVMLKGKPIFPVGAWDVLVRDSSGQSVIDYGFLAAGGNLALIGSLGLPGHPEYQQHRQPQLYKRLELLSCRKEAENIALIVALDHALYMQETFDENKKVFYQPVLGDEAKKRSGILAEDLRKLRNNPNILGYTIDEPENAFYKYYSKNNGKLWPKDDQHGLEPMMSEWCLWFNDTIRKEHPEAKLMPIVAWWTSYDKVPEMYDILMPDQYPTKVEQMPEITYDAIMAVRAARKAGGNRTVIYIPPMFDKCNGYLYLNREQQRYACFSPIVNGAMGILGWRLLRCSEKHKAKVVYPTISELTQLSDFFLGEWHDDLLSSDRDTTTAEHLKRFREKVTMAEGGEDGKMVEAKCVVPDVSHCLRRNPATGEYLLVVCSNLTEDAKVKLTIKKGAFPKILIDYFTREQFPTKGNTVELELKPFDTKAFKWIPSNDL